MATINLRNFYPWYTHDEFIEVSDAVVTELISDKRYQQTHERTIRRNKVHSLDAEDGTEIAAAVSVTNDPAAIFSKMENQCHLCQAINSLPEIQGRRIEAHYILGVSINEIAKAENVSESAVQSTIKKGLLNMKIFLKNFKGGGCFLP